MAANESVGIATPSFSRRYIDANCARVAPCEWPVNKSDSEDAVSPYTWSTSAFVIVQ